MAWWSHLLSDWRCWSRCWQSPRHISSSEKGCRFTQPCPVSQGGLNSAALAAGKFPIERCPPRALSLPAQAVLCFLHWTLWMGPCCPSKVVTRMWRSCICTAAVLWWEGGGVLKESADCGICPSHRMNECPQTMNQDQDLKPSKSKICSISIWDYCSSCFPATPLFYHPVQNPSTPKVSVTVEECVASLFRHEQHNSAHNILLSHLKQVSLPLWHQ